jgi:uncharacterized BrkB/YihY/UPF0761 family membrane protein
MKQNRSAIYLGLTVSLQCILVLSGCGFDREERLYAYGTFSFCIFVIITLMVITLDRFHGKDWFQNMRNYSRTIIVPLSYVAIPLGTVLSVMSFFNDGVKKLGVFIGVLIAVGFFCLRKWAVANEIDRQRLFLKVAQFSATVLVVLVFLYYGGEGLK